MERAQKEQQKTMLVRKINFEETWAEGRLTLELLASQTQCHLAAPLVIDHTRTCSVRRGFRGIPPVVDIAKQDIRGAQQPTDDGT